MINLVSIVGNLGHGQRMREFVVRVVEVLRDPRRDGKNFPADTGGQAG